MGQTLTFLVVCYVSISTWKSIERSSTYTSKRTSRLNRTQIAAYAARISIFGRRVVVAAVYVRSVSINLVIPPWCKYTKRIRITRCSNMIITQTHTHTHECLHLHLAITRKSTHKQNPSCFMEKWWTQSAWWCVCESDSNQDACAQCAFTDANKGISDRSYPALCVDIYIIVHNNIARETIT